MSLFLLKHEIIVFCGLHKYYRMCNIAISANYSIPLFLLAPTYTCACIINYQYMYMYNTCTSTTCTCTIHQPILYMYMYNIHQLSVHVYTSTTCTNSEDLKKLVS